MRFALVLVLYSMVAPAKVLEFEGGTKLGLANHQITFTVQHPLRPVVGVLSDCTGLMQLSERFRQGMAVDIDCDATKLTSSYNRARTWLVKTLGPSVRFSGVQTEVLTAPIPGDPYFRVISKGEVELKDKRVPQDFELRCISEPGDVVICRLSGSIALSGVGIRPPALLGMKSETHAQITGEASFSVAAHRGSRHRPGKGIRERWKRIENQKRVIQDKLDELLEERKKTGGK